MFPAKRSWCDLLRRLRASERGGVLIYLAFMLPMLMGAIALSVDLGRAFILNTELKDFSDAAALAGAAELDGRVGAMVAAEAAARSGLSGTLLNVQAFATDGGGPGIAIEPGPLGVVLLKNLPADGTNFTADDTAETDAEARFIFVSVVNRNVRSGLSRALGVVSDYDTSARSIAGFQAVHCRIPAMMMCNPLEDNITPFPTADLAGCEFTDLGVGALLKKQCLYGRQMLMKTGGGKLPGGGKAAYVPGDFGLLDCLDGKQGTNCVAPYVASAEPGYCIAATVNLRSGGAVGPVRTAINTRFDMYENPFFGKEGDNPDYRPALNVVKGHTGPKCKTDLDPVNAMAYPKDKCFVENNCQGGRFGSGGWTDAADANGDGSDDMYDTNGDGIPDTSDRGDAYWDLNHPPGAGNPLDSSPNMTRFELYRHEIENIIPNNSPIGENANPSCYTGGTLSDPTLNSDFDDPLSIDRRKFTLAAVNCLQYEADTGKKLSGNVDNVPVVGFVDVFLTGPAEGSGNDKADIFAEIIGVSPPGINGLRDIVQLYR